MSTIQELQKKKTDLSSKRNEIAGELEKARAQVHNLREKGGAGILKGSSDSTKLAAEITLLQARTQLLEDAERLAGAELARVGDELRKAEQLAASIELDKVRADRDIKLIEILKSVIELRGRVDALVVAERDAIAQVSSQHPGMVFGIDAKSGMLISLENAIDRYLQQVKGVDPILLGEKPRPALEELKRLDAENQVKRMKRRVDDLEAQQRTDGYSYDLEHATEMAKADLAHAERALSSL